MYPFLSASRHKTDKVFVLALPENFLFLWQNLGLQMINKVIYIVPQKSSREISFPWNEQYFILVIIKEVDMKNSENIPIYDDIDCRKLALIYQKNHFIKR